MTKLNLAKTAYNPLGGRPTKYREEMCHVVIAEMREGASKCEVAGELGISEETLYAWRKKHPLFSEAIQIGGQLSKQWWYKQGRKNLENKDFNPRLWYMNMKNRHGWADKKQIDHTSKGQSIVVPTELIEKNDITLGTKSDS